MQPLLAKLDTCVDADLKTLRGPLPPDPSDTSVQPDTRQASATEPTIPQRCDSGSDFVVWLGSFDHEPTAEERAEMRKFTEEMTPCVSVWKARCAPLPLFPYGSTNALCEIRADFARAHLENNRELAGRRRTYREYNSRGV